MNAKELLAATHAWILQKSLREKKEFTMVSFNYCFREAGAGTASEAVIIEALQRMRKLTTARKSVTFDVFALPEALGLIALAMQEN